MGRQAYLTTLTLGRSPYLDPLLDENGNFVISRHAHDFDDLSYQQQFDDHGHPKNNHSRSSARQLRRAQNDVLAAVGVVVDKSQANKLGWEELPDDEKTLFVDAENECGRYIKALDRFAGLILTWPVTCLRRRILTFYPYYEIPIIDIIRTEQQSLGILQAHTSGLPYYLLANFLQLGRLHERSPDLAELAHHSVDDHGYKAMLTKKVVTTISQALHFSTELPAHMVSALQTLYLTRQNGWLPVSFPWPYSYKHYLKGDGLYTTGSIRVAQDVVKTCLRSPFCLAMLREYLTVQINFRLHALFRQVLTRTDLSSALSAKVFDDAKSMAKTSIPGIGYPLQGGIAGRRYGPGTFLGALRLAFPWIYYTIDFFSGGHFGRSSGRLDPETSEELQLYARDLYCYERLREWQDSAVDPASDAELRRACVTMAFAEISLEPEQELVDMEVWTKAVFADMDADSIAATSEPQEPSDPTHVAPDGAPHATVDETMAIVESMPGIQDYQEGAINHGRPDNGEHLAIQRQVASSFEDDAVRWTPHNAAATIAGDAQLFHSIADLQFNHSTEFPSISEVDDAVATLILGDGGRQPSNLTLDVHEDEQNSPLTQRGNQAGGEGGAQLNADPTELIIADVELTQTEDENTDRPAPIPGITRAFSLQESHLRPVRRETDTRPVPSAFARLRSQTTVRRQLHKRAAHRSHHRMTYLSTFAVESLAWHASSILTSFVMLPLEALYLRSLARWAMGADNTGGTPELITRSPMFTVINAVMGDRIRVFGLDEWFGSGTGTDSGIHTDTNLPTSASSGLKYVSAVMLTLGLETLIRGSIWYVGTRTAIRSSKGFGWGKF